MSSPAAWHTDPTGKHDHRWWDGTKWTEHVADAGESKIDHLAPGDVPPAPGGATGPGDTSTSDTVAMDTSAGAWEGSADPQPAQPSWQQPGNSGHDATAQQPAWQQGTYGQGGYGQPPAWDTSAGYAPATGGTDGVAVAALVVGILSLLTSWFVLGGLGGVIALVLGLVALGRIKRNRSGGRGMAITGIVTGVLSIVIAVIMVVVGLSFFGDAAADFEQCMQDNNDEAFCREQLEEGILERFGQ